MAINYRRIKIGLIALLNICFWGMVSYIICLGTYNLKTAVFLSIVSLIILPVFVSGIAILAKSTGIWIATLLGTLFIGYLMLANLYTIYTLTTIAIFFWSGIMGITLSSINRTATLRRHRNNRGM